jgi:hypothetical protein
MIWDEARWDGKVKEKWGKSYPDEPAAEVVNLHCEVTDVPRPHFHLSALIKAALLGTRPVRGAS